MSVYHIVAFKVSDPTKNLSRLTEEFLALKQSVTRDGRPLVVSVKGGQQISTEDIHHDMQVVFIMEFGNKEDLAYYLDEDKAHEKFKTLVRGELGATGAIAFDFVDGTYPK